MENTDGNMADDAPKNSAVSMLKVLIGWHDSVEEARREGETGDGREKPWIALLALLHVESCGPLGYELGPLANLLYLIKASKKRDDSKTSEDTRVINPVIKTEKTMTDHNDQFR